METPKPKATTPPRSPHHQTRHQNRYTHPLLHAYIPLPPFRRLQHLEHSLLATTSAIKSAWTRLHAHRPWQLTALDPVLRPLTLLWREIKGAYKMLREAVAMDFMAEETMGELEGQFEVWCCACVWSVGELVDAVLVDGGAVRGVRFEDVEALVGEVEDLEVLKEVVGGMYPLGMEVREKVERVERCLRGFLRMRLVCVGLLNEARWEALERDEREGKGGLEMSALLVGE